VGWLINRRILKTSQIGVGSIRTFGALRPFLSLLEDFIHEKLRFTLGQPLLVTAEWG
jgi:hypothetical protein